jgi:hypothetical protein
MTATWDHDEGVHNIQCPSVDTLLFVSALRPASPIVANLTGEAAARIENDRDRAVLRAFLTLALRRLDTLESTTDAHL